MVAVTLKRMNPFRKMIARKKINDILLEIELSGYKQQQSYPTNEHFRGPINTCKSSKYDIAESLLYATGFLC